MSLGNGQSLPRGRKSFLQGALILAGASVISRLLGVVYRIPLTRLIGDQGMGLFTAGYNFYNLFLSVATAGINVAISKLIAEKLARGDERAAHRVFRVSLTLLTVTGLVAAVSLAAGAMGLVGITVHDPRAYYSILALAPALFLVALEGAYRGYFQGYQLMAPSAVSQVVEQIARVTSLLVLAYLLLPRGLAAAAGGAAAGAFVGAAFGLAYLLWAYVRKRREVSARLVVGAGYHAQPDPAKIIMRRIFVLAIPISVAGLAMAIMGVVDTFVVPDRLQSLGYSVERAMALYGQLSAIAWVVVSSPALLSYGLQASLVPSVSEADALGDRAGIQSKAGTGLRLTVVLGLPAVVGLWLLATPIATLLFDIPEAGVAIAALAAAAMFLMLQQTSSGVLQGLGRTDIPVVNLLIGAGIKTVLTWYLTGIPALNIRGAAYGSVAALLVSSALNVIAVRRLVGFKLDPVLSVLKPLAASAVMGAAVYLGFPPLARAMGTNLATLAMVAAGALVYGVALLLVGGLLERDFSYIPRVGPKVAGVLKRVGLLRG